MASVGPDPDLDLEFTPKPEFVRMARHAALALARLREVPEAAAMDVELAVSEACTLAVARSAAAGHGPVRLLASIRPDAVEVEVRDMAAEQKPSFERSLSLPVIRGLVDELAISPRSDGPGTCLRMLVSIPVASGGGSPT